MFRVHVDFNHPFTQFIYKKIDPYLSYFSIYQDWMMFAPNPSKSDIKLYAKIDFLDGTKDTFVFGETDAHFWNKKLYAEKFRKISEAISEESNKFMHKDIVKFALRKVKEKNFTKIPKRVTLIKHFSETPPMQEKFIRYYETKNNFQNKTLYVHEVF
jgi:hypothetical protein